MRTSALRRTVDNVTCVVVAFDGFQKQLQKFIDNNQDGTTVDVIEEIQLEPIPEYLSNQKAEKTKPRKNDSSMLLLDEHNDDPLETMPVGLDRDPASKKKQQILSEIAEEDDVSSISETLKHSHPYGALAASGTKRGKAGSGLGSFGPNGKASTQSTNSEFKAHSTQ